MYQMSKDCGQYKYTLEEQKVRFPFGTSDCKTLAEIQSRICYFCRCDEKCTDCPKGYKDVKRK